MSIKVYVGTSGWFYEWNREASFEWYVEKSGLNAVELNVSFYRFPLKSQVKSWSKKGGRLRWSIKVHRSITHRKRLSKDSLKTWQRFYDRLKPMDSYIDFYLFQLPPNYSCEEENLNKILRFNSESELGSRMAVEFRNEACFNDKIARWAEDNGITLVSIDAPIATWIVSVRGTIYLRMHGRETWYNYDYGREELNEIVEKILSQNPERIYVFFNNDRWMLSNARYLKRLLERTVKL